MYLVFCINIEYCDLVRDEFSKQKKIPKRTNDGVLTPDMDCLKKYLSQLLLLVPPGTFEVGSNERVGYSILSILEGNQNIYLK